MVKTIGVYIYIYVYNNMYLYIYIYTLNIYVYIHYIYIYHVSINPPIPSCPSYTLALSCCRKCRACQIHTAANCMPG